MKDASSTGHTITNAGGVAVSTAQTKVGAKSIKFSGSNRNINLAQHADWAFGTGAWTVEMWIRFDGSTSWADSGIMNWAAGTNYAWYFSALPAQVFRYSWNTPAYGYVESNTGLSRDTWYHMAVVREGTGAGGVKFFQDGVLVGTSGGSNSGGNSADSTNYAAQSQGIRIGNYYTSYPIMDNTYLDEIRISNVARYTANFTTFGQDGGTIASPTPFTSDANTKLLIHGEAAAAVPASDSMSLISTTTTAGEIAGPAPTKASIVLQTEDEVGTATINTDVKAGVSRDAVNYVDTTLTKISTWGSGNVYAANDVTMPGTVMTKIITVPTVSDTDITLDSSNYSTYVKTRANDGIVLRNGDYDYSGGAASDEYTVAYGPILDGDFWGTEGANAIWAMNITANTTGTVIMVFKSGVTFKPNGTQVSAWMDGASQQTNYRLYGIDSSFNGTQLVQWASGTVTNNQLYTGTTSNSTFFPAFGLTWAAGGSGNSVSHNRMSFEGTVRSSTPAKLNIDGVAQDTLTLTEGYTYKFDTSDPTMSGHTFSFATEADGANSSSYTTGVTTSGTPGDNGANTYTQIVVPASAPTLYYYCSAHASMGGTANTPAEFLPLGQGAMRYRIDTKNQTSGKITRIHGTSLAWS